jgi:hypothetical protein
MPASKSPLAAAGLQLLGGAGTQHRALTPPGWQVVHRSEFELQHRRQLARLVLNRQLSVPSGLAVVDKSPEGLFRPLNPGHGFTSHFLL